MHYLVQKSYKISEPLIVFIQGHLSLDMYFSLSFINLLEMHTKYKKKCFKKGKSTFLLPFVCFKNLILKFEGM